MGRNPPRRVIFDWGSGGGRFGKITIDSYGMIIP